MNNIPQVLFNLRKILFEINADDVQKSQVTNFTFFDTFFWYFILFYPFFLLFLLWIFLYHTFFFFIFHFPFFILSFFHFFIHFFYNFILLFSGFCGWEGLPSCIQVLVSYHISFSLELYDFIISNKKIATW